VQRSHEFGLRQARLSLFGFAYSRVHRQDDEHAREAHFPT
jgi:hypothetical protein